LAGFHHEDDPRAAKSTGVRKDGVRHRFCQGRSVSKVRQSIRQGMRLAGDQDDLRGRLDFGV
jgi:hypothetical protein